MDPLGEYAQMQKSLLFTSLVALSIAGLGLSACSGGQRYKPYDSYGAAADHKRGSHSSYYDSDNVYWGGTYWFGYHRNGGPKGGGPLHRDDDC